MTKKAAAKSKEQITPFAWKAFKIGERGFLAIPANLEGVYPYPDQQAAQKQPLLNAFWIYDTQGIKYRNPSEEKTGAWRTVKRFVEAYREKNFQRDARRSKLVPCVKHNG